MADPYDDLILPPSVSRRSLQKGGEAGDWFRKVLADALETAKTPGKAAQGKLAHKPQGSTFTEEDQFLTDLMADEPRRAALSIAGNVVGMPGTPKGALGAGMRAPGKGKVPAAAAAPAVNPFDDLVQYPRPTDARISTRLPMAVKSTENPMLHNLSIGVPEMRLDPKLYAHNTELLGDTPGFAHLRGKSPDEAAKGYINQAADNMEFLFNASPKVMQERSPHWYEGANRISEALANRWGVPRPAVSGGLAALSPQKDWYQNASLGERVGDIVFGAAAGKKATPEMIAFGKGSGAVDQKLLKRISGKSFDQLDDDLERAVWLRLRDEAHNTRAYRDISPEGGFGGTVMTGQGKPRDVSWGSFGEIDKAIRSMTSGGDLNIISPAMGTKHKVRSFYNNIETPMDRTFGDVTADTHQVAAAQMRPLSGKATAVHQNFGSTPMIKDRTPDWRSAKSSSIIGVEGNYGLTADATREAAARLGMLPRAAQSATWEPVRTLFEAKFKNPANAKAIDDIWRAVDAGQLDINAARQAILERAGGIGLPSWAEPGIPYTVPTRGSTYR